MQDNNTPIFRVSLSNGTSRDYTEKDYRDLHIADWLNEKHNGNYSVYKLNDAPADTIADDQDYVVSFTKDGQTKSKLYSGQEYKNLGMSDWLEKEHAGNYQVQSVRGYRDAYLAADEDYWKNKADEQKAAIDKFDRDNHDFMFKHDMETKLYQAGEGNGVSDDYINDDAKYRELVRQKQKLQADLANNPYTKSAYKANAEYADEKAAEYDDIINGMDPQTREEKDERTYFKQARKLQKDVAKIYSVDTMKEPGENTASDYLRNFIKGHGDTFSDIDFWTMNFTEISRNLNVRDIMRGLQNKGINLLDATEKDIDDNLTPGEKALLQAFFMKSEAEYQRAKDMAPGYTAGQTSAESLEFMAEFLISGGIGRGLAAAGAKGLKSWIGRAIRTGSESAIRSSVKRGMIGALTRGGEKALTKGMKTATDMASKAVSGAYGAGIKPIGQAVWHTAVQPSTYRAITENMTQIQDNGELMKASDAIWGGVLDQMIENWSESMGGAVETVLGAPFKLAGWSGEKILGKTTLGQWGKWLADSQVTKVLHDAGFNGLIGEMGEEWLGNAVRVGFGLMSGDEFKDFASWHEQLEMAASFAPISLFGLGTTTYAASRQAKNYKRTAEAMRGVLNRAGMTEDEIADIMDTKHTKKEIADALTPVIQRIVHGRETNDTAMEDYITTLRFAQASAMNEVLATAQSIEKETARKEKRNDIARDLGAKGEEVEIDGEKKVIYTNDERGKFTHIMQTDRVDAEGKPYELEAVTTVKDADGNEWFYMGSDGSQVVLKKIGADGGKPMFLTQEQYAQRVESGEYVEDTQLATQYLDGQIEKERAAEERNRRNKELQEKYNAVAQRIQVGSTIDLGTEDAPMKGVVMAMGRDGVIVDFGDPVLLNGETLQIHRLSLEQAGNAVGVDASTKSDEQQERDAIDREDTDRKRIDALNKTFRDKDFTVNGDHYIYTRMFEAPFIDENGTEVAKVTATDELGNEVEVTVPLQELQEQALTAEEQDRVDAEQDNTDASEDAAGTLKDFRGNAIPMHVNEKTGEEEVDKREFKKRDPEAYYRWNDSRRGGDTSDSMEAIQADITAKTKQKEEYVSKKQAETDPDLRDELEGQITRLDNDINLLAGIYLKYDTKMMFEHQQKRLQDNLNLDDIDINDVLLGDEMGTLTDEQKSIAMDYLNAKAALGSKSGQVRSDIADKVAVINNAIDSYVNVDNGQIVTATLKQDDRKVFIIGGNVAVADDGSMVDSQKSDKLIIIKDAETGKISYVEPTQISRLNGNFDPVKEKDNAKQLVMQASAQSEEGTDGASQFNLGNTYQLTTEDGQTFPIQISNEQKPEAIEQEPTETEQETALSRIPVDKNGNAQFEEAQPSETWKALVEMNEGDAAEAEDTAKQMYDNASKELDKAQKSKPKAGATVMEIQKNKAEYKSKLDKLQAKVDYWSKVLSFPEAERKAAAIAAENAKTEAKQQANDNLAKGRKIMQEKGTYYKEDSKLGDYLNFEDFALRMIANGRVKFVWKSDPNNSAIKGLGAHLGFEDNENERKRVFSILANADKGGLRPDEAAQELAEIYNSSNDNESIDTMQALDTILDIIRSYGGKTRDMMNAAIAAHANVGMDERGYMEDRQGNPINPDGTLYAEPVASIDEITDEDFTNPTRSIALPKIPENVDNAIGANGKPVIIKKNIFEKVSKAHSFAADESRKILKEALYNPDIVGQSQPKSKKNNWIAIKIDDSSPIVVLEVNRNKDNVEIVGWYTLDDRNLERIKRQAEREDGELLILTPKGAAASLSTLPSDLSSESKVNKKSTETQEDNIKNNKSGKIEDYGEQISGARKDMLRDLAKSVQNTSLESLISLPFSKAFKKPNLRKAVEEGALRDKDARFAQATIAAFLSTKKPVSGTKDEKRRQRWGQKTNVEKWAEKAYTGIKILQELFDADERVRDKVIEAAIADKYVGVAEAKAQQQRISDLNHREFNGTSYPLNIIALYNEVFDRLGYPAGQDTKIPVGRIVCDSTFDSYSLRATNGEDWIYSSRSLKSFEDVVDELVYLIKVANADETADHPVENFKMRGINSKVETTGYRVLAAKNITTAITRGNRFAVDETFPTREAALKRIEELKAKGLECSEPLERRETVGYEKYQISFAHPITREFIPLEKEYDSKEEAIAAREEEHEEFNRLANEAIAAEAKKSGENREKSYFHITHYYDKDSDGKYHWYYGVALDDKYGPKKSAFNTMPFFLAERLSSREEAQKQIDANKERWESLVKDVVRQRNNFVFFSGDNDTRKGEDYRNGKDVTAEEFANEFGFRGVQFGNWANQADRQAALNNAYDSFMDMSKIIGVSPKAMSLNGELGIAFGSRGSGAASAHYEPDEVVINLTKTRGAGSLAHEWWHALDNYFSRAANVKLGYVTSDKRLPMREEMRNAFNNLIDDVEKSDYHSRSIDRGSGYWGTRVEETARLFAEWIADEMAKRGELNNFLASRNDSEDSYARMGYVFYKAIQKLQPEGEMMTFEEFRKTPMALKGFSYPTRAELETLGKDVRNIFGVVQERTDETTGNVALFQMVDKILSDNSPEKRLAYEVVSQMLSNAGIPVELLSDKAMREMAINATMLDTALPEDESSFKGTVISSIDGTKILRNLDNAIDDYQNVGDKGTKTFLGDLASALGSSDKDKSSQYATFETKNGQVVTIRISNHNATVSNFDNAGESNGISIVISRKPNEGMTNDGDAHIVEFFYPDKALNKAEGKPLVEILKSIKQSLYSGEYKDTTGLAQREEVNAKDVPEFMTVYHGSGAKFDRFDHSHMGEGEGNQAFGWGTYVTEVEGIGRTYAKAAAAKDGDLMSRYTSYIRDRMASGISFEAAKKELMERLEKIYEKQTDETLYANFRESFKKLKALTERELPLRELYTVEIPEDINSDLSKDEILKGLDSIGKELFSGYGLNDAQINAMFGTTRQWYGFGRTATSDFFPLKEAFKAYGIDAETIDKRIHDEAMEDRRKNPAGYGFYLNWTGRIDKWIEKLGISEDEYERYDMATGEDAYHYLEIKLGGAKEASDYLSERGYVGIKYPAQYTSGGRSDGARNYVIFNENDAKITDRIEFLREPDGTVYGATVGGKIYLNRERLNPNTPIHEYTHLWFSALEDANPELYKRGVELMKQLPIWEEVKTDPNYANLSGDDAIASECLSRLVGDKGADVLTKMAKDANVSGDILGTAHRISLIEEFKDWLKKFWTWVRDSFTPWTKEEAARVSVDDIQNMVLSDLAKGVNPLANAREESELTKTNDKFNEQLETLTENNADSVVLSLGRPSDILQSAGVKNKPMKLYGNKVIKKMRKHGFALDDLRDLPRAVADPIAVFNNYGEDGNRSILTELRTQQGNFLVSVNIGKDADIDFNIVRSVFGKGDENVVDWINKGLATYINKEKALSFLSHQSAPIAATAANAELLSAANIVKEFENPNNEGEKSNFQFIGEKGAAHLDKAEEATIRLDNLSIARQMENAGKDAKTIKLATGWERGADGKWRYEIADMKELNRNGNLLYRKHHPDYARYIELLHKDNAYWFGESEALTNEESAEFEKLSKKYKSDKFGGAKLDNNHSLEAYVDAPELFKAYPELKGVGFRFEDTGGNETASYHYISSVLDLDRDDVGEIVVNTGKVSVYTPTRTLMSAVLHEIQHAIQHIEGFSTGGTPENVKKEFNAAKAEWRARAYAHELEETAKELGGEYNLAEVENALGKEYKETGMEDLLPDKETRIKGANYFARGYADRSMDEAIKRFHLDESAGSDFNPYDEYMHIAGEVEARNVSERLGMTPEERRQTLASETEDVSREDQIILNDALSGNSYYDEATNVNSTSDLSKQSELDAEYMAAVESGDMSKAQQMVKDAFRAAFPNNKLGSTIFYKGKNGEWKNQVGGFFTDSYEFADYYGGGESKRFFINMENPYEYDFMESGSDGDFPGTDGQTRNTYDIIKAADEAAGDNPYDGYILRNVGEGSAPGDFIVDDYITKISSNVKSAEPVTYDDSGKVIPLSKRFSDVDDIRFRISKDDTSFNGRNSEASEHNGSDDEMTERPFEDVMSSVRSRENTAKAKEGLQNFDKETVSDMLMKTFSDVPEDIRAKITDRAFNNGFNFGKATVNYFADLAEREDDLTDKEQKAVATMRDNMKEALGLDNLSLDDTLWSMFQTSMDGGRDILTAARRAIVADKLCQTPADQARRKKADDEIRFSIRREMESTSAAEMYNSASSYWANRLKESGLDMYESVNDLIEAIEKSTGKKAGSFEDIRLALNQQSSKGLAAMSKYTSDYLEPLWDAIKDVMQASGMEYDDVVRYVMLKHAIERNTVFAKRDAKAFYQAEFDNLVDPLKKERKELEKDRKKALASGDVMAASDCDIRIQTIDLQIAAAQAKLDRNNKMVDNGTSPKYREFRENDYGGLTSMYSEYPGLKPRKDYKSDNDYNRAARAVRKPLYQTVADMEAAAQKEVNATEARVTGGQFDALWDRINAATKATLASQYKSNVISKAQYEAARDEFKYYVPLRGFKDDTAEDIWSYFNDSRSGSFAPSLVKAKGRKSEAENPFNWIGTMASSAIAQNIKNESKLALYYFITNRPNQDIVAVKDVWYQFDAAATAEYQKNNPGSKKRLFSVAYPPLNASLNTDAAKAAYDLWEENMVKQAQQGLAYRGSNKPNVSEYVAFIEPREIPQHIIRMKLRGKDVSLIINGNPRAAQAINGMLNIETEGAYKMIFGPVLRFMSAVRTSYNPEFWISNAQRDLLMAAMGMDIRGYGAGNFVSNVVNPRKIMRMMKDYKNGTLGSSEMENYYREFAESGAITGFTVVNGNDYWEKQINEFIDKSTFRKVMEKVKLDKFLQHWQDLGEAVEQMTRFSAFVSARKAGEGIVEATNLAKEISVNFNRKGSGQHIKWKELDTLTTKDGRPLSQAGKIAVYTLSLVPAYGRHAIMFFNAAIQGLNSMYKLWKINPKRFWGWMTGYFAVGVMQALLHALMDDDDDYLDINDHTRRNNLLLGYGGLYFKWSMPQEARAFYAMGDMFVNSLMGRTPDKNVVWESAKAFLDVMPISVDDGILGALPSVLQPAMDIARNKDFAGARIYNDMRFLSEDERSRTPKYPNALPNTGKVFINISKVLNNLSGGSEWDAGAINIHPETIQHIVENAGGGLLTTFDKIYETVGGAVDMATGLPITGEELSVRRFPFLNRILQVNDERTRNAHVSELFYFYKSEAEHTKTKLRKLKKNGDYDELDKLLNSEEFEIYGIYQKYEKLMKRYNEQIKIEDNKDERKMLMREQDEYRKEMIREISEIE